MHGNVLRGTLSLKTTHVPDDLNFYLNSIMILVFPVGFDADCRVRSIVDLSPTFSDVFPAQCLQFVVF